MRNGVGLGEERANPQHAGGYATQRGIIYQNRVAAYLAACCLAERVCLPALPFSPVKAIRCETGEPLADIMLTCEDESLVFVEVKRNIDLAASRIAPFCKRLVQQFLVSQQGTSGGRFPWRRRLDPSHDRLILITSSDSSIPLTKHLAACLVRINGDSTPEDLLSISRNSAEEEAFGVFRNALGQAWQLILGEGPDVRQVVQLLALFRISVLNVEEGEADEQVAKEVLSSVVLKDTSTRDHAWTHLIEAMEEASLQRASVTRERLRQHLIRWRLQLRSTPSYRNDISAFQSYTRLTLKSLDDLSTLVVLDRKIRIPRPVTAYLHEQAEQRSMVVIGEPGAGKSGVLHELASGILKAQGDVVFLAADRLEGTLQAELGLEHDPAEVLENWSGERPGFLLIDALDAARGAGALKVLKDLIAAVAGNRASRWRVIASIRIFDLRYSHELQRLFKRALADPAPERYQDTSFPVWHIKVPRFEESELHEIWSQAPELKTVLKAANPALHDLLDIPFNLRLIAEMVSEREDPLNLSGVSTQVGLLERYWLSRVILSAKAGNARELVLTEVAQALVKARRLTVSKISIPETVKASQFSHLCSDDVLVEQIANLHGRHIIGFSHHLLFDYAVSQLLIAPEFTVFLDQVALERDLSLFVRPSIDLWFKEAWLRSPGEFWKNLYLFSVHPRVPAIAKIIGPSVIPELTRELQQLTPITEGLASHDLDRSRVAEQWVVHVVGSILADVPVTDLELWSDFCLLLAEVSVSSRVDAVCQTLVDHILRKGEDGQLNTLRGRLSLSRTAILLLRKFTSEATRENWIVGRCISNVMDLFHVNRVESEVSLRRLITPGEIRDNGAEQGYWLARKLPGLFESSPQLAADVFIAFFGYKEVSNDTTSLSGSRILALLSSRKQDYQHIHWQLGQYFPQFVEMQFEYCWQVVRSAVDNLIEREHSPSEDAGIWLVANGVRRAVRTDYSAIWDSSRIDSEPAEMADAFFRKLAALLAAEETLDAARATIALMLDQSDYAFYFRRVLELAVSSAPRLADLMVPLFTSSSALLSYDLSYLIGEALRSNFAVLNASQRQEIELVLVNLAEGEDDDSRREAKEHYRETLLNCIPSTELTLPVTMDLVRNIPGDLAVNHPPYVSHGVRISPYSDVERMIDRGVPVDLEPNASLRAGSKRLWAFASKFANSEPQQSDVDGMVDDLDVVDAAVRMPPDGIHPEVLSTAEAELIAAAAAAAKLPTLSCSTPLGLRLRAILFRGMKSTEPVYSPEQDAGWEGLTGWGAPIQRIEAAAGLGALLRHCDCIDDELVAAVRRALIDPVPSVRFQIATRLMPLHLQDDDLLWEVLGTFIAQEPRVGVLSGAMYSVVNPLAAPYREKVIPLLATLLQRTDLANEGGEAFEWAFRIAAGLYIWQNDERAAALIWPHLEVETFNLIAAGKCLRDVQEAMSFSSDVPKESDGEIRRRAFRLVETVTLSLKVRLNHLIVGIPVEDRDAAWQETFQANARLVDFIGNQIYFGSGAYEGNNSGKTLSLDARRIFWHESRAAIGLLSEIALPSVAHHLVQTLESFIAFESIPVFHAIAAVVRFAKSWGYQYESMAVDLLVSVTERYLAEYRIELQNDVQSREELIDILETFVEAGWPSARRLSYRLEEIFR